MATDALLLTAGAALVDGVARGPTALLAIDGEIVLVGEPAVTSRYDAIAWVAPAAAASLGLAKSTTSLLTKLA